MYSYTYVYIYVYIYVCVQIYNHIIDIKLLCTYMYTSLPIG